MKVVNLNSCQYHRQCDLPIVVSKVTKPVPDAFVVIFLLLYWHQSIYKNGG